jgi:hypothetical protein
VDKASTDRFKEIWIDFSFRVGQIEWLKEGGLVLSLEDWITLMYHLHSRDSELEPHLRDTHATPKATIHSYARTSSDSDPVHGTGSLP